MVLDDYLSAGVHIGTKSRTKDMSRFIYKVRPDGLAVLDVQTIERRIKIASKFLAKFKKIVVVSRKQIGHKPAVIFSDAVGAKYMTGRFLPGSLTNPSFRNYIEPDVIIITDPAVDSQAIEEAVKMRIPIVAFCNTMNNVSNVDLIIPCNNRGKKSVAYLYYLLAKGILEERGEQMKLKPEDFEIETKRNNAGKAKE